MRHWTAPDHTRIVLDVEGEPDYLVNEKENRLILSFKNSSFSESMPGEMQINKPGIHKIIFRRAVPDVTEAEFMLNKHKKVNVFKLKEFEGKPNRVVIDIIIEEVYPDIKTIPGAYKEIIIVVDPGHGGEDPGAIGKNGTYEKDIVLSISREIRDYINQMPGYKAVLTREGDYYVSFNKRLQKARNLNAGLFLSVHADAARNHNAKGSSVYALSTGGASSEAAKLLAKNENLSDIFGGVDDHESLSESNPIIMNMFQTNTINLSKIYAEVLIKHLKGVNCVKYEIVQEAPFRVLKLPDIPAVLIETAFISNRQEEMLLRKKTFQQTLASAVSASIKEYFTNNRPETGDKISTELYEVKKGDTLFSIARSFNTDIGFLLNLNNLKREDTIFIGQKVIVPALKEPPFEKQKTQCKIYTVKKGDTLFSIAKKNSITLEYLLKINNMQATDTLRYGQQIKIP
ncbi:MAG: N-acetylmuramoyl-L-alanine amidase [Smithella sp.]|nr:N-acetylmuramoyl-L-alanine amidase [Smithella sp.]